MDRTILPPDTVTRIKPGDGFCFLCHRDIACFTHCCRQLELALTPYDLLRLRLATSLDSRELLEKYVIIEKEDTDIFPRFYLTMIDDGHASCAFVTEAGCSVYDHRPGACRTYPLGRATIRTGQSLEEHFVLLQEPHCRGFQELAPQTVGTFTESQELAAYNRFNDLLTEIQQHDKIRAGLKLSQAQIDSYTLALYDLDTFRERLLSGLMGPVQGAATICADDEVLLNFAMDWLKQELFGT